MVGRVGVLEPQVIVWQPPDSKTRTARDLIRLYHTLLRKRVRVVAPACATVTDLLEIPTGRATAANGLQISSQVYRVHFKWRRDIRLGTRQPEMTGAGVPAHGTRIDSRRQTPGVQIQDRRCGILRAPERFFERL